MKKKHLLTLATCLVLLTACQVKPSKTRSSPSTSSAPSQIRTSSQTEATSQTRSEPSSAMAPQSSQTESQPPAPSNEALYATTLYLLATDTTAGRAHVYAFYDVDGNGVSELLTAHNWGGQLSPAAIYYLQDGVPTYLARSYVASGGGRRESFTIYQDGRMEWGEWSSGTGRGTAYLYQLAADNSGHLVVGEAPIDMRATGNPDPRQFAKGRTPVWLEDLDWRAIN